VQEEVCEGYLIEIRMLRIIRTSINNNSCVFCAGNGLEGDILKLSKLKLRSSIFKRLVITFLIILIPVYALGIYMYNWGLHTVKAEISKSTIAQVSFYLEGLEKEVDRIKILQYDCLNDDNLNKLAIQWVVMSNYERTESMGLLQQRLVSIKNSSIYIKNVCVHILPIKRTISSNSGVDDNDMDKFLAIRVPPGIHGAQIISFKGRLYLSTLQQDNLSNKGPLYLIEIELNQDAFKQALAQFNTYEESGSVLISLINNGIIADQSDSDNYLFSGGIISDLNKEDGSGMEYMKINQEGYYIVHARSNYLNMALFRYIPEELILKPLQNFYIWVWVFSIVTICIILIYSFLTNFQIVFFLLIIIRRIPKSKLKC
jgi:two-component system sensor histidine kinase YesM